ncbi:MAG: 50S ribosomal protein L23 [Acidobacteria bacterium]|nr:50S ribosomal protein L23 [Acidobacteriota bacterium]
MSANYFEILSYPFITEKGTRLKEAREGRTLTFQVRKEVTKQQIKEAVEKIFEVKVDKVRTANFQGKIKRHGRFRGVRPDWKKAYVTLKPGQKPIEFFENL